MFKIGSVCGVIVPLWLSAVTSFVVDDDLIVTLPNGKIRGHALRSENDNVYYAFQEIPYASPPIGELRFKPPTPPKSWKGVLDTQENTKMCYQQQGIAYQGITQSEDCMYLNVYIPQKPGSSTLLPVYVWIHGGGFTAGSGIFQQYGPKFFIDSDIVIVAMNYRLGALGFLTTNDSVIPGNLGLRDQNLALKWVKENIPLFGGDPEQITIGGESAGAMSVGCQVISKQSEGLFRAAILQSGTALSVGINQPMSRSVTFALGKSLDASFNSDDSEDLLTLLQSVSAENITGVNIILPEGVSNAALWVPNVEDEKVEGAFLTGPFDEDIKNGDVNKVPILIGFNSEEEIIFASSDPNGVKQTGVLYDNDLSLLVEGVFNVKESNKIKAGSELRQIYTNTTFQENFAGLISYHSDNVFTTPGSRHADLQSQYADVYLYLFSYKSDLGFIGLNTTAEGVDPNAVAHGEDLGYFWDIGFNSNSSRYREEDILTRNRMLKLWSNFVKYLNPTPEEDSLLQNVTWPKVEEGKLNYLNINASLETGVDPKRYKEWKKVIDTYAIPPYITY